MLQHKRVWFSTRQPGFYCADCGLSSATFKLQDPTGRLGKNSLNWAAVELAGSGTYRGCWCVFQVNVCNYSDAFVDSSGLKSPTISPRCSGMKLLGLGSVSGGGWEVRNDLLQDDMRGDKQRCLSGSSRRPLMDTEQSDARKGPVFIVMHHSDVCLGILTGLLGQDREVRFYTLVLWCEEQDGVCSHGGREAETSYCLFWAPRMCHLKLITLLWSESLPALFLAPSSLLSATLPPSFLHPSVPSLPH